MNPASLPVPAPPLPIFLDAPKDVDPALVPDIGGPLQSTAGWFARAPELVHPCFGTLLAYTKKAPSPNASPEWPVAQINFSISKVPSTNVARDDPTVPQLIAILRSGAVHALVTDGANAAAGTIIVAAVMASDGPHPKVPRVMLPAPQIKDVPPDMDPIPAPSALPGISIPEMESYVDAEVSGL